MGAKVPERASLPNGDSISLRELFARVEGLRELLDERHKHYRELRDADSEAVDKAFKNSQMAIDKADAARAIHDAAVNEWRTQYNEQEKKFLPKSEYDNKMRDIAVGLDRLGSDMQAFPSKTEVTGKFNVQDSRFEQLAGRIQIIETQRSEELGRKAQTIGDKSQSNVQMGWLFAAVGVLIAIAGLGLSLSLALSR